MLSDATRMILLNKQLTAPWRYRLPILCGLLALILFFVAEYEHKRYYEWFVRTYPRAFEIDNSYNPPARLIALLICGPGILIPSGTNPYDPAWHWNQFLSIFCVMVFWFVLGWLIDRRSQSCGPIVGPLLRSVVYAALVVCLVFLCETPARLIGNEVRNDSLHFSLHFHGLAALILMDFVSILWFGGLSVFCATRFFVSAKQVFLHYANEEN